MRLTRRVHDGRQELAGDACPEACLGGRALQIVQVVPTLPPGIDGIGDYAVRLARALRPRGIGSILLAARPADGGVAGQDIDDSAARSLPEASPQALEEALSDTDADVILLHYSGYGYAKRGAPVWLAQGLRRWKAGASRRRLVVMFHELWAFGPPWTSSFWMLPLQRAQVSAILQLADAFLTNTCLHAARLRKLSSDRFPVAVLPVISNIGEPDELPPFQAREPLAAVFGQRAMRKRVYAQLDDFLPALRSGGAEGIMDIGPPVDDHAVLSCPLPVTRYGYLPPASASDMLLRARLGLLDYPLDFAAKSGIFAAYSAHGLVPLIRSSVVGAPDGLRHGVNLVRTNEPMPGLRDAAQGLARAAHLWYQEHALERTALNFAEAICPTDRAK